MNLFFYIQSIMRCRAVDLALAICALITIGGVGTARAAQCNAGYWLNNGECAACSEAYYCPGDDAQYACPEINMTRQELINMISPYVLLTNPYYSEMTVMVSTEWFTHTYNAKNIEKCGIVIRGINGDEARINALSFYYSESVGAYADYSACLYTKAYAGYYLSQHHGQSSSSYNAFKPCTNAPANAHYTGPGTPDSVDGTIVDANDCPWECDDGFGHTSDDRCLPLCRIGETAMNGINIYAEKHTKYAMAVPRNGATCWINATRDIGGKLVPTN
ncbi:MAG: hypothetical protein IJ560_00520 [Alphaproteobacteria bacterium]|nr:hypothetical protein [Alphaproteobacteria bacterium]